MENKTGFKPNMMSWLLLLTLAIGYSFAFAVLGGEKNLWEYMAAYALFWGLYLLAYYLCLWKRVRAKREAWFLLGAVLVLFLHSALYKEQVLTTMNFLILPLTLMLHAVVGAFEFPGDAAWPWARAYLLGWFLYPFSAIGKWFAALGALFGHSEGDDGAKAAKRNIILGILCGLPVLFVVCALLLEADQAMGAAISSLLEALPHISLGRLAVMLIVAVLFYSFLYNFAWGKEGDTLPVLGQKNAKAFLPAHSLLAGISMLLLAYLVFAIFQFTYLTGWKGLPAGLTYSKYAVSGFGQLLWVAAINLGVFSLGLCCTQPHKALKPFLFALLIATAGVLLSAFVRLGLYIHAYALTWKRVLSLWLMLYLGVAVMLCGLRLSGRGLVSRAGLLRICALLLVGWYVALNLVNVEGMIAESIFGLADSRGGILSQTDADYLRYDLSEDVREAIQNSRYREQVYYDVRPADLPE